MNMMGMAITNKARINSRLTSTDRVVDSEMSNMRGFTIALSIEDNAAVVMYGSMANRRVLQNKVDKNEKADWFVIEKFDKPGLVVKTYPHAFMAVRFELVSTKDVVDEDAKPKTDEEIVAGMKYQELSSISYKMDIDPVGKKLEELRTAVMDKLKEVGHLPALEQKPIKTNGATVRLVELM